MLTNSRYGHSWRLLTGRYLSMFGQCSNTLHQYFPSRKSPPAQHRYAKIGPSLKPQMPPAVCTKVKLLLDTDATKGCVTSWFTQKSPLLLSQENEVNLLHTVTDSNASIVPALIRQVVLPHIDTKTIKLKQQSSILPTMQHLWQTICGRN